MIPEYLGQIFRIKGGFLAFWFGHFGSCISGVESHWQLFQAGFYIFWFLHFLDNLIQKFGGYCSLELNWFCNKTDFLRNRTRDHVIGPWLHQGLTAFLLKGCSFPNYFGKGVRVSNAPTESSSTAATQLNLPAQDLSRPFKSPLSRSQKIPKNLTWLQTNFRVPQASHLLQSGDLF